MTEHDNQPSTRREFLRNALRGGALTGLAALTAALLRRSGEPRDHSCDRRGVCRGCRLASDCARPEAMSYRRAQTKRDGES